jgi:hypothetical protein
MLIDYPHSKSTHDFKIVKFEVFKNKKSIEQFFLISRVFTTCKWGVMYTTFF